MTATADTVHIHGGPAAGRCDCPASALVALDRATSLDLSSGRPTPSRTVLRRLSASSVSIAALSIETPLVGELARRIEAIALLSDHIVADRAP